VREGLVAAAVLSFAFLAVAYSRVAVTDVGSLAGVALALMWSIRAAEHGRSRDYALAGAAAGLAIAFKYTAGLVLLPLGIAALARLRADRARAVGGLALGGLCAVAVFALLNPFVFGSLDDWWRDLRDQADVAASDPKPGQESGGVSYYLDSLAWGLGPIGLAAALAGAVLVVRRDLVRGLILVAVPLALFAYLAVQSRYFGRWLLPAYPALAMLAGVAVARAAELFPRRGQVAVATALTLVVIAQSLLADVRTARVLGREDTLTQARNFLDERYPPGLRVSIEPAVPGRYFRSNPEGRIPEWLSRCPQRDGWTEPGWSYVA
jgi:4-amino-4-deoxy-L-arabinose transferase-like glycosyltransferase